MTMNAMATAININVIFRSVFLCRWRLRVDADPKVGSTFVLLEDVIERWIDVCCRACKRQTIKVLSIPRNINGTKSNEAQVDSNKKIT